MKRKIKALIQKAIDQTMMSGEFYLTMANLADHRETKETFQYLAKNEGAHKRFFQEILDEEVCPLEVPVPDVHLSELIELPHITRAMSPKEALALAIKREEALHKFYKSLESRQPPGEVKNFLKKWPWSNWSTRTSWNTFTMSWL